MIEFRVSNLFLLNPFHLYCHDRRLNRQNLDQIHSKIDICTRDTFDCTSNMLLSIFVQ